MRLPARHVHVSERETAHRWPDGQWDNSAWEDCTWCSAIMWLRLVYSSTVPASLREAELLRDASGESPTGPSNIDDLRRGLTNRYRFTGYTTHTSFESMWAALDPGYAAVVQGRNSALSANLRRWQPGYTGGHATCVIRLDSTDNVWWDDPLAPAGTDYKGQWVTKSQLRAWVNAQLGARHTVAKVKPASVWRASIQPYPLMKSRKFFVYHLRNGYIVGREERSTGGVTAPCSPPRTFSNHSADLAQSSYNLVQLKGSFLDDEWIDEKWARRV
jgi:hypothetical protein